MASQQVLTDNSMLSRIDRRLAVVETLLLILSGLTVFALMLLAVVSVGGRLFGSPVLGYIDYIEQAMPLIAFLGISSALRHGVHVRMDMLISRFTGRGYYAVEAVLSLLVLALMVLLVWGSWSHFTRSFDFAMPLWSRDSSFDIGLPVWPAKLVAPIAFGILCLRSTVQLWAYLNALIHNPEQAIAVPLPDDLVQQASREADGLLSK